MKRSNIALCTLFAASLALAGCGQNRNNDTNRTDANADVNRPAPAETTGSMASNTANSGDQQKLAEKLVDARVRASVLDQLQGDAHDVDISVDRDGVVKLSGKVNQASHQQAAERAAQSVPGVTRVSNDITVLSPKDAKKIDAKDAQKIRDNMLEAKVRAGLLEQLGARALDIKVDVDNGQVKLSGNVNGADAKQQAVGIAQGIAGVQGVQDKLDQKS